MDHNVKTYESHPDHEVVGKRYRGFSVRDGRWKTWFCDMHDPWCGFWMQSTDHDEDRVCVSERAIDRTFHTIWVMEDGEFSSGGYSYRYNKQEVFKL